MGASDEIRCLIPTGRGQGGLPAAQSRAEDRAEKPVSGAATESLMMPLEGGGEVRFSAVHGRVEMQTRIGKQRTWLTTPIKPERAMHYAARLLEIADLARAQRQAKGA